MLLEFSVRNFRSFETEHKLSLVASSLQDHEESLLELPNYEDVRVLRAAAIYGANGSGKSNLLQAIKVATGMVSVPNPKFTDQRFRLSTTARNEPTEFQIRFLYDDVIYEYSFATNQRIVEEQVVNNIVTEKLRAFPKGRPQLWYSRINDGTDEFEFGSKLVGEKKSLTEKTRGDSLFLAVAAAFNHPQLRNLQFYLAHFIRIVGKDVNKDSRSEVFTSKMLSNRNFLPWLGTFLSNCDLGIHGVSVYQAPVIVDFRDENGDLQHRTEFRNAVKFLRPIRGTKKSAEFELEDESDGTQRLYSLLGHFYLELFTGRTLFIDELDASLHPHITRRIFDYFQDPKKNPSGAQLIFTTHDTTLLDQDLLRRDQVWFVEKDKQGASQLYSLHDFHPRKDASLERGYLAGRYGAVPFLGDLKFEWPKEKKKSKVEVE